SFADGTINGMWYTASDGFPGNALGNTYIYLSGLRYTVGAQVPLPMTPAVSDVFTSGVWTGNLTAHNQGTNVIFRADDNDGHKGVTPAIVVASANGAAQTRNAVLVRADSPQVQLKIDSVSPRIVKLRVNGAQLSQCVIESSSDLKTWKPM